MTLLVVLGVVVVATIVAALYLSLKSGRGDEPDPGDAGAGDWPARGGSSSGRSPSLAARVRSMTGFGKAGGPSRRRSGRDDDEDFDVPDYVRARRASAVGARRPTVGHGMMVAGVGREIALVAAHGALAISTSGSGDRTHRDHEHGFQSHQASMRIR